VTYSDSSKCVRLVNTKNNNARQQYGHLPTKIQSNIKPYNEVHVDLIGPWMIPQCPSKSPKLSNTSDIKQLLQVLASTMIDLSTNLLELIVVLDKESCTMARALALSLPKTTHLS
jgi:hypothetical protein